MGVPTHEPHDMSEKRSTQRTIRLIHESMMVLGSAPSARESAPVHAWLDAELALLDRLRTILAGATHLDGYALIAQERLETARNLIDSAIGAKSLALDLLHAESDGAYKDCIHKQLG